MHPRDEELALYSVGRLSPSRLPVVKSHLLECRVCMTKLERMFKESLPRNPSEAHDRRRHVRTLVDQPASIRVVRRSVSPATEGRVINISDGGLKIAVPETFEPGTLVQIRVENRFILAEVRYCVREGDEFHVGVETKDVFEIPR